MTKQPLSYSLIKSILPNPGRMLLFYILLTTCLPNLLISQAVNDPSAEEEFRMATTAYKNRDFLAARLKTDQASGKYLTLRDKAGRLECIYLSANIHAAENKLEEALEELDKATQMILQNPDEFPLGLPAKVYYQKGFRLRESGRIVEALQAYQSSIDWRLKIENPSQKDLLWMEKSYRAVGNQYSRLGRYTRANESMQEAYEIILALEGENSEGVLKNLLTWSIFLMGAGKCQAAEGKLLRAVEIYEVCDFIDPKYFGAVLVNLGDLNLELGKNDEAIIYYQQALAVLSSEPEYILAGLQGLAEAQLENGDLPMAEVTFAQAWRLANSITINPREKGQLLVSIGDLFMAKDDPKIALGCFHLAQLHIAVNFSDSSFFALPNLAQLGTDPWNLIVLERKADAFEKLFKVDPNPAFIAEALRCYYLGFDQIDFIRQSFTTLDAHAFLGDFSREIYERAVGLALEADAYLPYLDSKKLAFQFCEKNKARAILEQMHAHLDLEEGGLPDSILVQGAQLEESVRQLEIQEEHPPGYWAKLREARQKADWYRGELELQFPRYFEQRQQLDFTVLDEVKEQLLGDGKMILEYFFGEKEIFVFGITEQNLIVKRIPNSLALNDTLDLIAKTISINPVFRRTDSSDFPGSAHYVWETLVKPILEEAEMNSDPIHSLAIIPDGKLWYIPFEVLLTSSDHEESNSLGSLPYAVKNFDFQYGISALFLLETQKHKVQIPEEGMLIIAPDFEQNIPCYSDPVKYDPLTFNEEDIVELMKLYPNSMRLSGKSVSQSLVESVISSRGILYFFTHAEADEVLSSKSRIVLSCNENDPGGEYLYAYEIGALDLNAFLVVLGACETGLGTSLPGEGLVSLAREFLSAGSPSVLMTLWKVNRDATPRIVHGFFRNLAKGENKSRALQLAKKEYLNQCKAPGCHPYFWSAFVQVGNANSIR